MSSIQKLMKLVEGEDGKIVIVDLEGNPKLVVMSVEEYERIRGNSSLQSLASRIDRIAAETEDLNRQITLAQMHDISAVGEPDDMTTESSGRDVADEQLYIEPLGTEELA